jgi:ribulose-5-phosphate 4-epimerase/fuculose-1-phosphate aldolase
MNPDSALAETKESRIARLPAAPALPSLSARAQVALLARMLHREGYDDHLAGHITWRQDDGTFLATPFGFAWDEIRAGDIMRITGEGVVLEGPWEVTRALALHFAIYRRNDAVNAVAHNHPRWATVWAASGRVPPVYDQTSAFVSDPIALFEEYGEAADRDGAEAAAQALGTAGIGLLAKHGVVVVGNSLAHVYHRAAHIEWRSRQAWHVETLGPATPMDPRTHQRLGAPFDDRPFPGLWEAMIRRELRIDASVLNE